MGTNGTFVCSPCSGVHREFNHRIKGIVHSSFTADEVVYMKNHGNEVVNKIYLAEYSSGREKLRQPDGSAGTVDVQLLRVWIRRKYTDKAWQDQGGNVSIENNGRANVESNVDPPITKVKLPPKQKKHAKPDVDLLNSLWDETPAPTPVSTKSDSWDAFSGGTSPCIDSQNETKFDSRTGNEGITKHPPSKHSFNASFGNMGQEPNSNVDNDPFSDGMQSLKQKGINSSFADFDKVKQPPPISNQPTFVADFGGIGQSQKYPNQQQDAFVNTGRYQQQGSQQQMSFNSDFSNMNQSQQHMQNTHNVLPGNQPLTSNEKFLQLNHNQVSNSSVRQESHIPSDSNPVANVAMPSVLQSPMDDNDNVNKNYDAFANLTVNVGDQEKCDNSQNRKDLKDDTNKNYTKSKDQFSNNFSVGQKLQYRSGSEEPIIVSIMKVHLDNELVPFYTIGMPDGREKQTDNAHLCVVNDTTIDVLDHSYKNSKNSISLNSNQELVNGLSSTGEHQLKSDRINEIMCIMQNFNDKQLLHVKQFVNQMTIDVQQNVPSPHVLADKGKVFSTTHDNYNGLQMDQLKLQPNVCYNNKVPVDMDLNSSSKDFHKNAALEINVGQSSMMHTTSIPSLTQSNASVVPVQIKKQGNPFDL